MIDGADLEAWAEDSWVGEVKIGRIEFKYNRDCTRCLATTVRKLMRIKTLVELTRRSPKS